MTTTVPPSDCIYMGPTDTRNATCPRFSVIRSFKGWLTEPCVARQGSLQALLALTPGSAHHPSTHELGKKRWLGGWPVLSASDPTPVCACGLVRILPVSTACAKLPLCVLV